MTKTIVELTRFDNADRKPLSKTLSWINDKLDKPTAANMVRGTAERWHGGLTEFADMIGHLESHQAIACGVIKDGFPDRVDVTTKARLNGQANTITRSKEFLSFKKGDPAFFLVDYDSQEIIADVRSRIAQLGGPWAALCSVFPELGAAPYLLRASTSAGLRNGTGAIAGSDGIHAFVLAAKGTDNERFIKTLHNRCILQGLCWGVVFKNGTFVMRSIVDSAACGASHLVFEGAPIIVPPLIQDPEARRPRTFNADAAPLDTLKLRDLSEEELKTLESIVDKERERLTPEIEAKRGRFVEEKAKEFQDVNPKLTLEEAKTKAFNAAQGGILPPEMRLQFENRKLGNNGVVTVAELLKDPGQFVNKSMRDPIEPEYGSGKAMLLQRTETDGTYYVRSFAHGGRNFELGERPAVDQFKLDLSSASKAMETMNKRYATVILGGATAILENYHDTDLKKPCIKFIRKSALFDHLAPRTVAIENDKGEVEKARVAPWWWHMPGRRSYSRIEFRPIGPNDTYRSAPGVLNMWNGLVVQPKKGDCSRIKDHIRNIICSGDEDMYGWQIAWIAQMFQEPTIKPGSSVAWLGDPGTGRSTIAEMLGAYMPDHYFIADSPGLITGRFNAHQARVILLICEEAFWGGNKQAEGKLKTMITGNWVPIEFKGKDAELIRSYYRLLSLSNEEWAIPVSMKDRRWCVPNVDQKYSKAAAHPDRKKYFDALREQTKGDEGRAAFLHFLLEYPVHKFDLQDPPDTAARAEQKKQSMSQHEKWWYGILNRGVLPGDSSGNGYTAMTYLYEDYLNVAGRYPITDNALGMFIRKWVGETNLKVDGSHGKLWHVQSRRTIPWRRGYQFGSLSECRDAFVKQCPGITWDGGVEEGDLPAWQFDNRFLLTMPEPGLM
jgi:Family of unknown function (DUF5906)